MIYSKIGIGCGVSNGISEAVLEEALKAGIRYFDTSTFYPVGAISEFDNLLRKLDINRGVVHLSLKLWITDLGQNRSDDFSAHSVSLWSLYERFRVKYNVQQFSSVVVHWPLQVDKDGLPDEFRIAEVWPQLEQLVDLGIISGIGVSNFNIVEMQRLLDIARIKPYSAQIEFNPFAFDADLLDFCLQHDIKVIGHSPFSFGWSDGHLRLFDNAVLKSLAAKHGIPVPQLVLAWVMSKGVLPIPGTTNPAHVRDFVEATKLASLPADDLRQIDDLNTKSFHYLGMYGYFGAASQCEYFAPANEPHASIFNDGSFEKVSIYDSAFMPKVKAALTEGAGFLVLPSIFERHSRDLQSTLAAQGLTPTGRWAGMGPRRDSILNAGPAILDMMDDPLLSLIIESLLGWDCKLDNITLSTSRVAPDNAVFGPHQDSPFDNNPGAPLPPPSYPMVLQVIVAVDEFREDNGPLYAIPHSHKKRQRVNLPWQGNLPPGQIPEGAVKMIVPKGSAIIAVGHIWHGTFSNLSDTPRMGLLMEYVCSVCDARDKFTIDSVDPKTIEACSRRIIRLLNNGKLHQHDSPGLLAAFKRSREQNIPFFAKPA